MKSGDLVFNEQDGKVWMIIKSSACIGTDIRMHEIFDGEDFRLCTGKVLRVVSEVMA